MQYGFSDAIAKVGIVKFVSDLFWIGMFYHLYNQVNPNPSFPTKNDHIQHNFSLMFSLFINLLYFKIATNTLERVAPLTHAVGNVLKRVFVIGFSIVVFGNYILQTFKLMVEIY